MKFWSANYSACVVYTKTIIHLSVGESDGYLPPLFATIRTIRDYSYYSGLFGIRYSGFPNTLSESASALVEEDTFPVTKRT